MVCLKFMIVLSHTLEKEEHQRRMDGSFGFSGCFTIILGGLGLYKPSSPNLMLNDPLVELDFNELEKRIEEWAFIAISPI